jgi:hypothetical protein
VITFHLFHICDDSLPASQRFGMSPRLHHDDIHPIPLDVIINDANRLKLPDVSSMARFDFEYTRTSPNVKDECRDDVSKSLQSV